MNLRVTRKRKIDQFFFTFPYRCYPQRGPYFLFFIFFHLPLLPGVPSRGPYSYMIVYKHRVSYKTRRNTIPSTTIPYLIHLISYLFLLLLSSVQMSFTQVCAHLKTKRHFDDSSVFAHNAESVVYTSTM